MQKTQHLRLLKKTVSGRNGFATGTLLALILALGLPAQPAFAQLDEIIVTARKRAESLQDVPLAITAFTSQTLEAAAIDNLSDVASLTPGLTFTGLFGEQLPTPTVRGISQTQIFGEVNTAVFVDGIFVSGRQGLNLAQLDIGRIEVIKGPQSALYGRNSFSGAINIVTARPSDDFTGKAELTVGNRGRLTARGSVSGPIAEGVLSARIAAGYDEWDGSYDNASPNSDTDIGGYEYKTILGSLLFTPTENFEILGSLYYSDDHIDQAAATSVAANCEPEPNAFSPTTDRLQNFCGTLQPVDQKTGIASINGAEGDDRNLIRGSLNIQWDTDIGTFSSLTGYSRLKFESSTDGSRNDKATTTFLYQPMGMPGTLSAFEAELLRVALETETEEISQELRYTSPEDDRVRGSLGAYYYDEETTAGDVGLISLTPTPDDFGFFAPVINIPVPFPPFAITIPIGDAAFGSWFDGTDVDPTLRSKSSDTAWAVFGSLEADLVEDLTARVELRYTDEEKEFASATGTTESGSWTFVTTRIGLDWQANEDLLIYATAARGAKPGGINFDAQSGDISTFDPETLWNYELGAKFNLWGDKVVGDVAAFYIDWDDIIVPQLFTPPPPALPTGRDTNAGKATVMGIETQLAISVTDHLSASVGASFTDAEYDDAVLSTFATFPTFAPDGDVSGNKLLRQSKWQANGSLTYTRPFFGDFDWYTRTDVSYQSKQFIGADNQGVVPARTNVNLRGGIESDRFKFELWIENLLDNDEPLGAFRDVFFTNTGDGVNTEFFPWRFSTEHPKLRTFGATARVRF